MRKIFIITYMLTTLFFFTKPAFAMHIMEGFLPLNWAVFWWLLILPVIYIGFKRINALAGENPRHKLLLAMAGAFVFVISALKIPSVTGSSSHATGVGLGAILFGPVVMSVVSVIVLLFQALLLAHGGISTLGANAFSMGVVGPMIAYLAYRMGKKLGLSSKINVFAAAFLGDLLTYVTTALQLTLAFSTPATFLAVFVKFLAVFAITQIPLAIAEGIVTVFVFNYLESYNKEEILSLQKLSFKTFSKEVTANE